ncbi:MAG: radical SAM protein [Nanoarchaeota archaeon]|nr:B12-binding domain-containing radical SAM protein [Nanoarchaeota archaeon]
MKILLVNPPRYKNVDYVREGRCMQPKNVWNNIWPPLTLNYIATLLKKNNQVIIIDCIAENKNWSSLEKDLKTQKPDIVIINNGFPSAKGDLKLGSLAKKINPKIITITFGIFPTLLPEETLNNFRIDFVVMHEPEITMQELIAAIKNNSDFKKVKGIAYKEQNKIVFTKEREFIKDLDEELGFPDRNLIKNEAYTFPFDKKPFALLLLGRGCPFNCSFCVAPVYYGRKYRVRNPKKVVDEMQECYEKFEIKNFMFWGESFTTNRKFSIGICDELIKRKLKFDWITTTRVDTLDLELLNKMKKAGCYLLGLGIETPNEEILKNVNKNTSLKQIKNAIAICKKAKVKTMGHFIFGFPGETRKTAKKTIKFAKNCGVDYAQFYCAVPYPKTKYWDELEQKKQIVSKDWDLYEQNFAVTKTDELTPKDIMKFRTKGFNSFYIRPKFVLKQLTQIRSFKELWNTFIAGLSVLKWFSPKKK